MEFFKIFIIKQDNGRFLGIKRGKNQERACIAYFYLKEYNSNRNEKETG